MDGGLAAEVKFDDGRKTDFAPDFVLHHCEPAYEYHVSRVKPSRIGARVRRLRKARGLSLAAMAKRSGIRVPNICRIESCKHEPEWGTLERLARGLGVPVLRLFAE